jgi:dipeptidyl aminopeptidase/acylaminoacyl peptidase
LILMLLVSAAVAAPPAARFDAVAMMRLQRLADPHLSPDGRWVAYQSTEVALPAGTRNTDIWVVSTHPASAAAPRRVTHHAAADTRPRWSPDGKRIAFLSARDGASQVYVVDAAGGAARKVTALPTEAGGVSWIDDRTLLVTSDAYPACDARAAEAAMDEACQKKRLDAAGKPSSARVYDRLLFRHWDTWDDERRTHLVAVPLNGGPARDLTPGDRDVPPFSVGGADDYAVSPDGAEVAFARNDDPVEATSTNADLFVVPVRGGAAVKVAAAPGYDGMPRYSPDGAFIAYRSQLRAGFEADRWRLMVYDRRSKETRALTDDLDRHVEGIAWSPDSRTIYFTAGDEARQPIFSVSAAGGPISKVREDGTFDDVQASPDGKWLLATKVATTHPTEIYRVPLGGGAPSALTHANDAVLAPFALRPGEGVTYDGAAGKKVQAWIVKPADFDPAKRYPLLVLVHGGPQGVWGDAWSYRWNYQVFANAGYVVFAPNPRGSVGWGQAFVDDITLDWEGKVYEDLMRGVDFAEALPYVEKGRTSAAGASYGGYMVNWIAGHTDRFRALVSHDGIFDLRSMYTATEELWFTDWEFGGPPWERPELYLRASPSRFVSRFKTPTLVIHGEKDYRVPIEQGISMFTALQLRGVPSRLVVFPDENHWVLKPANSVRWYQEVLGWLDKWTKS